MNYLSQPLLTRIISKLPATDLVTLLTINKSFYKVSLDQLRNQVHVALLDDAAGVSHSTNGSISLKDSNCNACNVNRGSVHYTIRFSKNFNWEEIIDLQCKYLPSIHVLKETTIGTTNNLQSPKRAHRPQSRLQTKRLVNSLVTTYCHQLTCLILPNYCLMQNPWFTFPQLRHLVLGRVMEEESLRKVLELSLMLESIEFETESLVPGLTRLLLRLRHVGYSYTGREPFTSHVALCTPVTACITSLQLNIQSKLTVGDFNLPNLVSFHLCVKDDIPCPVLQRLYKSLCNSKHLIDFKMVVGSKSYSLKELNVVVWQN